MNQKFHHSFYPKFGRTTRVAAKQVEEWLVYHATEVETDSRKIEWQHSVEVKSPPEPINITTKCLLTISICNLCLKKGYLVHPYISPFSHLDILVMRYKSPAKSWIKPCSVKWSDCPCEISYQYARLTRKNIFAQVDCFWSFAYAAPCYVEYSVKYIRMAIMETDPATRE